MFVSLISENEIAGK